ncbi:MAG: hypothetical protein IH989_02900 [Planctomycetes bacterium]|nr:hypothetical protein [Planctomycetota bacterium]
MKRGFGHGPLRIAIALLSGFVCPVTLGQDADTTRVLESIPAKFPLAIVFVDAATLDASVAGFSKRTGTEFADEGLLADLKRQLPVLEWMDLSHPVGLAYASLDAGTQPIVYARVPDFRAKVKTLEEATQEEGVWRLTFDDLGVYYARVVGDYVIASAFNENLTPVAGGKSLADAMKHRADIWRGRDVVVHVNFEPLRAMVAAQINKVAAMAPMIAMLAAQQGGDPASLITPLTATIDATKRFVAQLDQLDLALAVSENAVSVTLWGSFKEGSIRKYLAGVKPSDHAPFAGLREQPYAVAVDYGFPGDDSPFFEFLFDKLGAAPPPDPSAQAQGDQADAQAQARAERVTRDLYKSLHGADLLMAVSPDGVRLAGNYFGRDPKAILELATETLSIPNVTLARMKAGTTFESLGTRTIGGASVNEFAVIPDTSNMYGAAFVSMMGKRPRIAMSLTDVGVGWCAGSDAYVTQHFAGGKGKPLRAARHVAKALAALPPKRNITLLLDPAAMLTLSARLSGTPPMDPVLPGPPIAVSLSLSAKPVRLDLRVPARAIARYHEMLSPADPL